MLQGLRVGEYVLLFKYLGFRGVHKISDGTCGCMLCLAFSMKPRLHVTE